MHNYSSCPIYQTNNINPPKKKRYPLEREREREVLPVEKEEGEEAEELEGSSETGVIVAKEGAGIEGPNR